MRKLLRFFFVGIQGAAAAVLALLLGAGLAWCRGLVPTEVPKPALPMFCVTATTVPDGVEHASIIELHRNRKLPDDTVLVRGVTRGIGNMVCFEVKERPYEDSFDRVMIDGTNFKINADETIVLDSPDVHR